MSDDKLSDIAKGLDGVNASTSTVDIRMSAMWRAVRRMLAAMHLLLRTVDPDDGETNCVGQVLLLPSATHCAATALPPGATRFADPYAALTCPPRDCSRSIHSQRACRLLKGPTAPLELCAYRCTAQEVTFSCIKPVQRPWNGGGRFPADGCSAAAAYAGGGRASGVPRAPVHLADQMGAR